MSSPTSTSAGSGSEPRVWSRTPAAGFAAAVLGIVSVLGIVWSITHPPARAIVTQVGEPAPVSAPSVIHLVDLNSATSPELQLLPGIGPVTAQSILVDREENGMYVEIGDLDRVHGIGQKTIESIRDWVKISPIRDEIHAGG